MLIGCGGGRGQWLGSPAAVPRLAVTSGLRQCDIGAGWALHSVANSPVADLSAPGLVAPRLRQGRVGCVFYNFDSKLVVTDAEVCFAAQLFINVLRVQAPIPLRATGEDSNFVGAADAYATSDAVGIGGWWLAHCWLGVVSAKCSLVSLSTPSRKLASVVSRVDTQGRVVGCDSTFIIECS